MSLFSWLSGGSNKANQLLEGYADERFIHVGARGALSFEERRENLKAFVDSIPRRLDRLKGFAANLSTVLADAGGNRGEVESISQSLDRFCKSHLSGLTVAESAFVMDWRGREAQGLERQMQTLAIDIGAFCGTVGIACAPKYQWVIDETRYTRVTILETSGRVVIGHNAAVVSTALGNHVDPIDIAAFALTQIVKYRQAKSLWRPNYFYFLSDLADGRYT